MSTCIDELVNISNPVDMLNALFASGLGDGCLAAASANGHDAVNIARPDVPH